ncbi:MAG: hypothetical protein JEZ06_20915 [Anaerolineaceae bacterium]|nr:hypothetical protein [Anaerolineaceae bacterium]
MDLKKSNPKLNERSGMGPINSLKEVLMSWLYTLTNSRILNHIVGIGILLSSNSCASGPAPTTIGLIEPSQAPITESLNEIPEDEVLTPAEAMQTSTAVSEIVEATVMDPTATLLPTQTPTEAPTSTPTKIPTPTEDPIQREFDDFVEKMKTGNPDEIVGVYVEGVLKLRVVQQPNNNAAFVSSFDGEATQFLLAFTVAGNIGLLAHNYLAGRYFFDLRPGDIVQLIYGDGSYWEYEITDIQEYQALSPNSPTSDFIDLRNGNRLSATGLFYQVYGGEFHLTFQTCIARDNRSEWGRLFPIAMPLY